MRVRDVEIVLTVAKLRSFTKTAERLLLTQPAISQSVKRIEDDFGAPIFLRTKTSLEITEAGREAIRALERIEDIYLSGFKHRRPPSNARIVISKLLASINLAGVIRALHVAGVDHVEIETGSPKRLIDGGDFDIAILPAGRVPGSHPSFELVGCWIGRQTGLQIRAAGEYEMWSHDSGVPRSDLPHHKIVDVSDCSYAYQLATRGVGVTAALMFESEAARRGIPGMPTLPSMRFEIVTENNLLATIVTASIAASPADLAEMRMNGESGAGDLAMVAGNVLSGVTAEMPVAAGQERGMAQSGEVHAQPGAQQLSAC